MQTLISFFEQYGIVQNDNIEAIQTLIYEYGLVLLLAFIALVLGKLFWGKIRFHWSALYRKKGISNAWSSFLSRNSHLQFIQSWKSYFSDHTNSIYFISSAIFCIVAFVLSAKLMAYNAGVPGKVLNDPIMNLLPVTDWSKEIFFIEYLAVILTLFNVSEHPLRLINGLWGATILQLVRCCSFIAIRLSPPDDMIFLVDPFVQFFYGDSIRVANDLFFSGHVALVVLFFFLAQNKYIKIYLFFAAITVAVLLVWQHVHYSYDVLFAPIASYSIYKLVVEKDWSSQIKKKYKAYLELNKG
ncbi:MAG: hypothetical protein LC105_08690 [Chitinophagales bacterium]|nr:hypothetical protein [Chitinophagales bacterium]MCZ2393918.1 hypothetical protein [Chitinophagales bacterium]